MNEESLDWVMIGHRKGDEYIIIASKTLTAAQLEAQVTERHQVSLDVITPLAFLAPSPLQLSATVHMKDFVMVSADSYGEALQEVLRIWNPNHPERARPELPGRLENEDV